MNTETIDSPWGQLKTVAVGGAQSPSMRVGVTATRDATRGRRHPWVIDSPRVRITPPGSRRPHTDEEEART
ncbi:hypothetical protein GCM10023220_62870 [Streptomyces ziwulingensis]|uniref:Uncharacterized protein n=1 Tax=Streptomyces ziwulingensis TaxID=1045501 RepID=A0ABP9CZX7_9ACTN